MNIDLYTPCPCGSGKKIKFCCCKDIVADLEKFMRKIEGEQRLAALETADSLIAKHGERAALLALKSTILFQLGEMAAAEENIKKFVAQNPGNSVALAQSAIVELANDRLDVANEQLQRALAVVGRKIPMPVFDAAMAVAEAHLQHGNILPARGYLILLSNIGGIDKNPIINRMQEIDASPSVPLFFKQYFRYDDAPADAPWKADFDAAKEFIQLGAWKVGLDTFKSLLEQAPDSPVLLRNIAILRGWLGQDDAAATAWRAYAQLDAIYPEDAIEAEAMALLLAHPTEKDVLPQVTITFQTPDTESLLETLATDNRVKNMKLGPAELGQIDQPPPKAAYALLDRESLQSGAGITLEQLPQNLGRLLVFGRETDREARIVFDIVRDADVDKKIAVLKDVLGEQCQDSGEEKEVGEVSRDDVLFQWRGEFPEDTPHDDRVRIIREFHQAAVLEAWPDAKRKSLNNLSLREAASELKNRVAAHVLLLDLNVQDNVWAMDFNKLRESLGLEPLQAIDPTETDPRQLPLMRLARLDAEKMTTEQLTPAFYRVGMADYRPAVQSLGRELVKRDDADAAGVDRAQIYASLSSLEPEWGKSLALIQQAQKAAEEQGKSPARYLLAELQHRMRSGDGSEEAQQVFNKIQSKHLKEPGIEQALFQLLVRSGVINPDGSPAQMPQAEPAEEAGKLWTPESAQASEAGKESKLWVPGSD